MTADGPIFYTVAEVAEILRVDAATVYGSIRADAFPAVRIRSRYVIPAGAVIEMAEDAARCPGLGVDLARRTRSVRHHRADHQR